MTKPFQVPMSPADLPQQRLVEMIKLPPLPKTLEIVTNHDQLPTRHSDRESPGKSTFLVALEWAWSPMHNRLQGFSLERHASGDWVLWGYFVDFVENDEHPWVISAVCPHEDLDERTAGIYLLLAALREAAAVDGLDRFHWIADQGLLGPAEMRVIADKVWASER